VKVSLSWLSALLGRELDADDVQRRLAFLGAPVEAVERTGRGLGDVVVGLVEEVQQHPDADRLSLCRVNDGAKVWEVVCGAPNVKAGAKYPYAAAGTVLPGGLKLSARKIRGIVSNGMLCSAAELELGLDRDGIMELSTDAEPGTPLLEALPVEDVRLEIEVTANRPDLLCHKGVARDLGAAYGAAIKLPPIPEAPSPGEAPRRVTDRGSVDGVEVAIEDTEGCPRYMGAVIRGVRVGPSPTWLEARLRSIGARPINNVVDATNYVLYELNQPMHAFDLANVRGNKIIVRRAAPGETLVTLDGESRSLTPEMTMICDGEGPTAIAGVMGGEHSEVAADTTDVLLECAYFDPLRIRRTRQALKMNTEASYRFERGTDIDAMADALRRAVQLIRAVAGGEERESAVDVYPKPTRPRSIFLRPERVEHVLGVPIPRDEVEQLLVRLGFPVAPKDDRLHVQVPGWRPDVSREVDLIEEIARLRGYDSFPVEMRPLRPSAVPDDPVEQFKGTVRRLMTGRGLDEARSLSLSGEGGADHWQLQNPLSVEESFLRRDLLPGLVRSVERNWAVRERNVRLFEIGRVFHRGDGNRPHEIVRLAGVVTGARVPPHWTDAGNTPDCDLWDLKSLFEDAAGVACAGATVVEVEGGWEAHDAAGERRGWASELDADAPAWAAPLYGFELDLVTPERAGGQFRPLPTTPPAERDVALVLPEGITAADVEAVMREVGGVLLAESHIFDEYRGVGVAGRSVAWRLVFRAPDRTLRDKEVEATVTRILTALEERLGVERRQA